MASAAEVRAGKAYYELGLKDKTGTGLRAAEKRLKAFGTSITAIGRKLFMFGAAGQAALGMTAKSFEATGSALNDMAARTGMSVEALGEIGYAAQQSGGSMEDLETGVKKMQKTLAGADEESKKSIASLAKLGLKVEDLKGMSPENQLVAMLEAISKLPSATERTAAAMEVFGKSGTKLLPMMAEGTEAFKKRREEAIKNGRLTKEDTDAADALGDAWGRAKAALTGAANAIGAALAPAMTRNTNLLSDVTGKVTGWIRENQGLVRIIDLLTIGVLALGVGMLVLGPIISGLGTAIGMVTVSLGVAKGALLALVSPWGLIAAGAAAGVSAFLLFTESGGQALNWLGERFSGLAGTATDAWQGISAAMASGDLAAAAQVAFAALQVAWSTVVAALTEVWETFTTFLLQGLNQRIYDVQVTLLALQMAFETVWANVKAGFQLGWARIKAGFELAWNDIGGTFSELIDLVWQGFKNLWDMVAGAAKRVANYIYGVFDAVWSRIKGLFTDTKAAGEAEAAKKEAEANAEMQKKMEGEGDQRMRKRNEILKRRDDTIAQIDADRRKALADAKSKALGGFDALNKAKNAADQGLESGGSESVRKAREGLAQAQADFDKVNQDAILGGALAEMDKRKKENAAAWFKSWGNPKQNTEDEMKKDKEKTTAVGTFSAFAARGISGSGLIQEAIKSNTKKTAENTAKTNQKLDALVPVYA